MTSVSNSEAVDHEIVDEREVEAIFESERQATLADAENRAVLEEMRSWESTLEDGIDFTSESGPD